MKIAATGHRPDKLGREYDGVGPISDRIRGWMHGIITKYRFPMMLEVPQLEAISGMALGVDMLWAEVAIHNKIPLTAAIPCRNQTIRWPSQSVERYARILANPLVKPVMVSDADYNDGCMQRRNEWMVDHCDLLIAIFDGSRGGTANTVAYARKIDCPIEIFRLGSAAEPRER